MLKILIVEDSPIKFDAIKKSIESEYSNNQIDITNTDSINTTKRILHHHFFDLCILDINLPLRSNETPQVNSGKSLLDEIHEMDHIYKIPNFIIGLTSFEDIYLNSAEHFNRYFSSILLYEENSKLWKQQINKLIKKILLKDKFIKTLSQTANKSICVVNALDSPEMEAVLNLPWDWSEHTVEFDPTSYYKATVVARSGNAYDIYIAASEHMGMPSVTSLAMKMICNFSPEYIGMTGISAGTKNEVSLGDVIVADPSWDWGSGKYVVEDGISLFKSSAYQFSLCSELRNKFRAMQRSKDYKKRIREGWKEEVPSSEFNLHIGPVASGSSVLADENLVKKIRDQHRKMLGVEMEAFGIFSAANNAKIPQPKPFSIKSVCDFADEEKADDYHSYAAYTSAMTLKELVEFYL